MTVLSHQWAICVEWGAENDHELFDFLSGHNCVFFYSGGALLAVFSLVCCGKFQIWGLEWVWVWCESIVEFETFLRGRFLSVEKATWTFSC